MVREKFERTTERIEEIERENYVGGTSKGDKHSVTPLFEELMNGNKRCVVVY